MKFKKAIGIALVVFVAAASIFASSFKGKARTRFGLTNYAGSGPEFSNNLTFGFKDKSSFDGAFFLDEVVKTAQGKDDGAFAEVEAYAKFRVKFVDSGLSDYWTDLNDLLDYRFGFSKADFVIDKENNFKISILGKSPMVNYARGWETEENGVVIGSTPFVTTSTAFCKKHVRDSINGDTGLNTNYARATGGYVPNLGLTYDKYSFVFGLDGGYAGRNNWVDAKGDKADKNKVDYLIALTANDIAVSDEMKFSLEAGLYNSNRMKYGDSAIGQQTHILYGGQFKYKTDSLSVDVGATGNVAVNSNWQRYTDVDERNAIEASLNVAYKGDISASFDAWFLDNQALWSDDEVEDYVTFDNTADLGYVYRDKDGNIFPDSAEANKGYGGNNRTLHKALSMQATVKPVKNVGITLTAQDVLNQGIYGIKAPISLDKSFTITPAFEYTVDTNKMYGQADHAGEWYNPGDANGIWEGRVEANYRHDLFSIFGSLRLGKEALADAIYIKPYLNIQTRTLINGARLSFVWTKGTFGGATAGKVIDGVSFGHSGKYHSGNGFGDVYIEARIDFK